MCAGAFPKSFDAIDHTGSHHDLICHEPTSEWAKMAPLKILSFDIETDVPTVYGRTRFPTPNTDKVFQIAVMLGTVGMS